MNNPNRRQHDEVRPLASIPNKEGFVIIGVRADGSEARLTVFVDEHGLHTVPGYKTLVGWKLP